MSTKIPGVLRPLAAEIRELLVQDARTVSLLPARPAYRRPESTNTKGYWTELGRLGRRITVELWIDCFSGHPTPRAWYGFASSSSSALKALLALAPLTSLKKRLSTRTLSDITSTGAPRFINPLRRTQFGLPILEVYDCFPSFLGIYAHHEWPLPIRHQGALVADVINFVAPICDAYRESPPSSSSRTPSRTSWPRPLRAIEKAAVRHVRSFLSDAGYSVRSREQELCGYDLHAVRGRSELHVEVKACKGSFPRFFLTRNEMQSAERDPSWRLAIVLNASRPRGRPRLLTATQVRRIYKLEPTVWEGTRSD